jgi:hypothetical protein
VALCEQPQVGGAATEGCETEAVPAGWKCFDRRVPPLAAVAWSQTWSFTSELQVGGAATKGCEAEAVPAGRIGFDRCVPPLAAVAWSQTWSFASNPKSGEPQQKAARRRLSPPEAGLVGGVTGKNGGKRRFPAVSSALWLSPPSGPPRGRAFGFFSPSPDAFSSSPFSSRTASPATISSSGGSPSSTFNQYRSFQICPSRRFMTL